MSKLAATALLASTASAQYYGNGVGKHTFSVSHAADTRAWFLEYLPCAIEEGFHGCTDNYTECGCAEIGRVRLNSPDPQGTSQGWGLHTVNATDRPFGDMNNDELEAKFAAKFGDMTSYDSFMDFNVGFWVSSLDPYLTAFHGGDVNYLPLTWSSADGKVDVTSILVSVPEAPTVVLEFMSHNAPATELRIPAREMSQPRFHFEEGETPESVFGDRYQDDSAADKPLLIPARVSHMTSDSERDAKFYTDLMYAQQIYSDDSDAKVRAVNFANYDASFFTQIHLVQRDGNTTGDFSVKDYEDVLNTAHQEAFKTPICGLDKYIDTHVGMTQHQSEHTTEDFAEAFAANDVLFHTGWNYRGTGVNMYVVTPNGVCFQMAGSQTGNYNTTGIPTFDGSLCGQGTCDDDAAAATFFGEGGFMNSFM